MSNMIDGFLNVSRLESGKIVLEKQHFDLKQLIIEIIDEIKLTVATHTINLAPCGQLEIYADPDKIGSVVTNLLTNAVKYSPTGKHIGVHCERNETHVTVSVTDEGMGIKPNDIGHLFDRFYRVRTTQMRDIPGFGIGLYLCAEIIAQHEGKIWVESEPGKGSAFFFSLPLQ